MLGSRGLFIFSAHNLLYDRGSPFAPRGLARDRNPVRVLALNSRRVLDYFLGIYHYLRNRPCEEYGEGYAMVVDQLDQYQHLMYLHHAGRPVRSIGTRRVQRGRRVRRGRLADRPQLRRPRPLDLLVARRVADEGPISTQPL